MKTEQQQRRLTGWIESVYDGDTFTAVVEYRHKCNLSSTWREVRLGLFEEAHERPALEGDGLMERIRIRLLGIDAPEMRGEEKAAGKVSAQWVRDRLSGCESVAIAMTKTDSFGRWLCNVECNGHDLATAMLDAGMAQVYAKTRAADREPIQEVPW